MGNPPVFASSWKRKPRNVRNKKKKKKRKKSRRKCETVLRQSSTSKNIEESLQAKP